MKSDKSPLKEGMVLYAVPVAKYYGKPGPATVVKTGRKWAQVKVGNRIDFIQFHIETWEQKPTGFGYDKEYYLWTSKEAYDDWTEYLEWKQDFLRYKADGLPKEFWDNVRKLYESRDWN